MFNRFEERRQLAFEFREARTVQQVLLVLKFCFERRAGVYLDDRDIAQHLPGAGLLLNALTEFVLDTCQVDRVETVFAVEHQEDHLPREDQFQQYIEGFLFLNDP
ncbi:hypothetical protein D3C85_1208110 [compost metagenome]